MAEKSGIYVYAPNEKDFTTTGLAGDLQPLEAVFQEEKNGISQVRIRMPYDQYKKWQYCRRGNIIKCMVPVRVPPVVKDGEYATQVSVYQE